MISKKFQFRKRKKEALQSALLGGVFLLIFVGVIGALVVQNVRMYQKRAELQKQEQELRAELDQLLSQNLELESVIIETESEEYQEEVLREQGLYKKPGEEVVTVLPFQGEGEGQGKEQEEKKWWDPRTWFK